VLTKAYCDLLGQSEIRIEGHAARHTDCDHAQPIASEPAYAIAENSSIQAITSRLRWTLPSVFTTLTTPGWFLPY